MVKPGWKTTEAWITFAVLLGCGYVALDLSRPTSQVIAAMVVAALKAGWYVSKRTELKLGGDSP